MYGNWPSKPSKRSKRVIIDYLTRGLSIKSIIDKIESENVPDYWLLTMAVPKEQEFKEEDARFYGELTPEMRLSSGN